jgi:hypothetical protein
MDMFFIADPNRKRECKVALTHRLPMIACAAMTFPPLPGTRSAYSHIFYHGLKHRTLMQPYRDKTPSNLEESQKYRGLHLCKLQFGYLLRVDFEQPTDQAEGLDGTVQVF